MKMFVHIWWFLQSQLFPRAHSSYTKERECPEVDVLYATQKKQKKKQRKEVCYRCKSCHNMLALCPAPCFETYHTRKKNNVVHAF